MECAVRFITLVLLVLVAAGGGFFSDKRGGPSAAKVNEQYWAETGLGSEALEELLQDNSCKSSERYFLACANAVTVVAQKYGLTIRSDESLAPIESHEKQALSEKELLLPWKKFLSRHDRIPSYSFLKIWRDISNRYISASSLSYAVGLGMNGFLSVFRDPHTYLLPADYYNSVVARTNNKSLSVGIIVGRDVQNYFVKKVLENSSSYLAGVKKGDLIVEIQGRKAADLTSFQLGDLLRGNEGSELELKTLRRGEIKKFLIVRTEKTLPTVTAQVIEGIKPVGILTVNKFAVGTCEQSKTILQDLLTQNIRGLLLDLRDNPGGQMEEAACLASLFVGPRKQVFTIKTLNSKVPDEVVFGDEEQIYSGPVAVLVNSGSASASEIVAGALQYYKRAVLVGERTFGKGSFQEGEIWSKNEKIAIFETKGFYYLPSGKTPQMVGLEPDFKINFEDRFALREEDQFLNPLKAENQMGTDVALASRQKELMDCANFDSDFLTLDDPEIKVAHRVLGCPSVASRVQQ